MKKKIGIALATFALLALLGGCAAGSSRLEDDTIRIDQYKGLEITEVENTPVTDDDIQQEIDYRVEMSAELKEVDRAAKQGDTMTVDYEGTIDGKTFEGNSEEDSQIEIGSGMMVEANGKYKGFEEQLIGHKAGDEFDVTVQFPDDYEETGDLNNKVAVFHVKCKKVEVLEEQVFDDAWVKKNSDSSKTTEEFKEEVRKDMEESNAKERESRIKEEVQEVLLEHVSWVKKPEDEIKKSKDEIKASIKEEAEGMGMTVEDYYEAMGLSEDDVDEQFEEEAENQLKFDKAMELIAKEEKITLSDKEYEEQLKTLALDYGYEDAEAFEKENGKDLIKEYLLQDKVLGFLAESAKFVKAEEASTEDYMIDYDDEDGEGSTEFIELD